MNKYINGLKRINWRLFTVLILMGLIPTIYTTVRVFLLEGFPNDWGVNIASQMAWVGLLYEIMQEALILPLFFIIGKELLNKKEFDKRITTGFIIIGCAYALLSLAIFVFARQLTIWMAQNQELVDATVNYIRLETIASVFSILLKYCIIIFTLLNKDKLMYAILGAQMVLTITLDFLFLSKYNFSLNLGVNGIAITNIISNAGLLVLAVFILYRSGVKILNFKNISFDWVSEYSTVAMYSGVETLIRNLAFMYMVVRMVNVVGEQGTFWVTNNFIWGWLLLPILQLGELIKRDVAEDDKTINMRGYIALTSIIIIVWIITIPLWKMFMQNAMNISNFQTVYKLALLSLGFYMVFAFNNIIDSIFYGIGRSEYMLFQSVVVNTLFYGTLFVLFKMGIYQPTLVLIAVMFAAGIAVDSILTFVMYFVLNKKGKITHKF